MALCLVHIWFYDFVVKKSSENRNVYPINLMTILLTVSNYIYMKTM